MGKIKLRIGNDRKINWRVMRNGVPEDFRGRDLTVKMVHSYGIETKISYTIEDNVIHIVCLGKDQMQTGDQSLVLIENDGKPDMYTVDHCNEICFVAHTCEEAGEPCGVLEVEDVNLTSDIAAPQSGLSAYELAVAHGFVGTEEEWLESLNGDVILPRFSVNDKMELIIDTDVPTDRFSIENGCLIINV